MHPVLVTLPGGITLHSYGVALATSVLAAIFGAILIGRREGVLATRIYDLAILTVVGAVAGSRLEYVRTHWAEKFAHDPAEILDIRGGGYVFFGGLILAVALDLGYMAIRRMPMGIYADAAAVFIALGVGITRLGCFGAGCCYGRPTDLPWAVTFPPGAIAPEGIARHPTQLYESAFGFALTAFLLWYHGRRKRPGQVLAAFGVIYSVFRFANEHLRGDGERGWVIEGLLTNGQATSLVLIVICGLAWAWLRASKRG